MNNHEVREPDRDTEESKIADAAGDGEEHTDNDEADTDTEESKVADAAGDGDGLTDNEDLLREMVDPPALRAMRKQQERIRDMVDPPALRAMREQLDIFRATFPASFGPGIDPLQEILASNILGRGATLFEGVLRSAHEVGAAKNAALAARGISRLLNRDHAFALDSTAELLRTGALLFRSSVEDSPARLLGEVPGEIFRAIDADSVLENADTHVAAEQRSALSENTTAELDGLLADFEPQLLPMLKGARRALLADNPDRARHVCVSLRELLGHFLRRLAPDDSIREWSTADENYHNGKPTRRARLKYLYRSVEGPELRAFIAADVKATIELLDALNRATHVSGNEHGPEALTILVSRTEGMLVLILRLRKHASGAYSRPELDSQQ